MSKDSGLIEVKIYERSFYIEIPEALLGHVGKATISRLRTEVKSNVSAQRDKLGRHFTIDMAKAIIEETKHHFFREVRNEMLGKREPAPTRKTYARR